MFQEQSQKIEKGPFDVSQKLYIRASEMMPGGVNFPVRAFKNVGGVPVFMGAAEGAILQDMDENQYIDYVGSWGPMILGHAHPEVIRAVKDVMELGLSFGAPSDRETCLVDYIINRHKHVEMVRLVNSGTEATMSAVRLARGFTGKDRMIKCEGCYHGHGDSFLVAAGSGLATNGISDSAGVPSVLAALTTVVPYNDLEAMEEAFKKHDDIACVIIEPVAGNMGVVPPVNGYLAGLRALCDRYGALLIFDEVMTGCRLSKGSAQELYGIKPDLSTFGKVIGGGMPLAAYGGRRDVMERLSPLGDVYQAGTLSGNPVAVTAGIETLERLSDASYIQLEEASAQLENGLRQAFADAGVDISINRVGSMLSVFFSKEAPKNWQDVKRTDTEKFKTFFHAMLERGVYLPPSPYESWFVSLAHTTELIDFTIEKAREVARTL